MTISENLERWLKLFSRIKCFSVLVMLYAQNYCVRSRSCKFKLASVVKFMSEIRSRQTQGHRRRGKI